MRRGIPLVALLCAACSGASFRATGQERRLIDPLYAQAYTVDFAVACDSCRVEYGQEGSTRHDVVEGGWTGSVPLGFLREGSRVRVMLLVRPLGDAVVVAAEISVGGRTVATGKSDEPGQPVSLRARVGPD